MTPGPYSQPAYSAMSRTAPSRNSGSQSRRSPYSEAGRGSTAVRRALPLRSPGRARERGASDHLASKKSAGPHHQNDDHERVHELLGQRREADAAEAAD